MSTVYPSETLACENVLNLVVSIFVKNVEPDQQVFDQDNDVFSCTRDKEI